MSDGWHRFMNAYIWPKTQNPDYSVPFTVPVGNNEPPIESFESVSLVIPFDYWRGFDTVPEEPILKALADSLRWPTNVKPAREIYLDLRPEYLHRGPVDPLADLESFGVDSCAWPFYSDPAKLRYSERAKQARRDRLSSQQVSQFFPPRFFEETEP